ncbi:helix-turn-helix transcriptional regulator [bacterium]|nr:helix-turn-helix transcriptional regulator [bacterium]
MKQNKIDNTAGRLGRALYDARIACNIPYDNAAMLLHITPNELSEYERGTTEIPHDIMIRMLVMGYKLIHARTLEEKYRRQRNTFKKLKQPVAAPE